MGDFDVVREVGLCALVPLEWKMAVR